MRKLILLLVLSGMLSVSMPGQDPIFSQFYAAPLQTNPAFAGVTDGPRISLNYRNQWPNWPNAYITYSATYEQPVDALSSGFGLRILSDEAGDGIYRTNQIAGTYSYEVAASRDLFFKIGFEVGVFQQRIAWYQLIFGDQLDPINGFNTENGVPFTEEQRPPNESVSSLDIGTGLLVFYNNFYGGISVKHLNRPNENVLPIDQNLSIGRPQRLTVHGGAQISLQPGNKREGAAFISPNFLYINQGNASQLNIGAYAGHESVFGGLWYRMTGDNVDAAIFLVGYKVGKLRIGYSYDLTVSGLSAGVTGGSHELGLSLTFDNSERRRRNRYSDCFKMFN